MAANVFKCSLRCFLMQLQIMYSDRSTSQERDHKPKKKWRKENRNRENPPINARKYLMHLTICSVLAIQNLTIVTIWQLQRVKHFVCNAWHFRSLSLVSPWAYVYHYIKHSKSLFWLFAVWFDFDLILRNATVAQKNRKPWTKQTKNENTSAYTHSLNIKIVLHWFHFGEQPMAINKC